MRVGRPCCAWSLWIALAWRGSKTVRRTTARRVFMKPTARYASVSLLGTLLLGCVTVTVPGETRADPVLKRSVTDFIKRLEVAYHCSTMKLTVTDTKVTTPFDGMQSQEKWDILSCNGENHSYEVSFRPSPRGGTDFRIRKWP